MLSSHGCQHKSLWHAKAEVQQAWHSSEQWSLKHWVATHSYSESSVVDISWHSFKHVLQGPNSIQIILSWSFSTGRWPLMETTTRRAMIMVMLNTFIMEFAVLQEKMLEVADQVSDALAGSSQSLNSSSLYSYKCSVSQLALLQHSIAVAFH